jgi:hypothetical protein
MSLATKHVATVLVGSALVLALSFAFVTPAKADMLSDLQAQVAALLAQISSLSGSSTPATGAGCYAFTKTHQQGQSGGEIMWIQKFLNSHGAQIAASGAGSPGNETAYFGALTKAAVAKWQAANSVSPAAGYWGPVTRAKVATVCGSSTGGGTTTPVTGNGLKVMLASDSPSSNALVQGQAIADLAHFTFSNPTGSEVTVTSVGFKRTGVSSDSTISNVYLFKGGMRITDSAGVSSSMFNFNDSAGVFKVPAGGSVTISVRADIAGSTNGQQIGAQLVSVGSPTALDSSVALPITGATHLISSATLGTVAFTYTAPTGGSEDPSNDIRVFEASANVGNHAAWLQSLTIENRGTSDNGDFRNLRLYVDGTQVGTTVANLTDDKATFDLTGSSKNLTTGTHIIKVVADIIGGSGKTFDFQLRRAADVMVVDAELTQPILSTDTGGSFPVSGSGVTIGAAGLSIVKKADSPSDNVAVGASNVLIARYEVRAAGENVKIEALTASTTVNAGAYGLDNAKIFFNGVQVGSTKDIPASGGVEFTFGSSLIARQGQVEILEVYADAKDTSGNNLPGNASVQVGITVSASNTEGVGSGDSVSTISNVTSNTRTVTTSTATISKASGYGNQTMVAGTNNAKLGSFTISSGSTEGVNVNTVNVVLSSNNAASVTDLMLKDSSTGTQLGNTKTSPSTSNSFSVNLPIPASGTKTIDVYGNVKSSANAGAFSASIYGSGTGMVTSQNIDLASVGTPTALQTITVGSGTLSVTRDAGTPVNANIVAGLTQQAVGKFNFAAANSSYTVNELKVKVPSDAATSVSSITLKYKNSSGVEQTISQALQLPSSVQGEATATFTGLSFYVPQNDSANVDVYVDVPTISSGAKSGAAISVALDWNEGFKVTDGAGTQTTTFGASDVNSAASGYGTKYVKKTVPTLARLTTGYTANTVASGIGLYRFTMTADAAGAVDWRKLSFNVSTTTGGMLSAWTLYDVTGSAVAVNTTAAEAVGGVVSIYPGVSSVNGEAQQIGAGSTKTYELRSGTVVWGSGASVTISFAEDTSAVTNLTSLTQTGNMIWSDRSSNSHTTVTSDWTNGYLVKDTDSDTRSCQYGTPTTCNP